MYKQYLLRHYAEVLEHKKELRGYYIMLGNIKAASVVTREIEGMQEKLKRLKEDSL